MPTFTTIALDRLIEPGTSGTLTVKSGSESKLERRNSTNSNRPSPRPPRPERTNSASSPMTSAKRNRSWQWISPELYTTPESTPLPDSPTSFPPSPYIINHKRRGPRLLNNSSRNNSDDDSKEKGDEIQENGASENEAVDLNKGGDKIGGGENEIAGGGKVRSLKVVRFDLQKENEGDDFYDFHNSASVKGSDGENNNSSNDLTAMERTLNPVTPMAEFYDAWEELSSESGPQLLHDIEIELREMQSSLLTEIERRKQAEVSLDMMRDQWTVISEKLSDVGLRFPSPDSMTEEEVDPADELCRQLCVAKMVSNAIGKGIARAEIEEKMESQIDSMNFEITRLMDRLHYYETVNREMSQRNQEVKETARRLRQTRKRRQRWIWASIATAITFGTTALIWSYLPPAKSSPSVSQSDSDRSSSN